MKKYKISPSPFTNNMYIIKVKYWWLPFWVMEGFDEYTWKGVVMKIKQLE